MNYSLIYENEVRLVLKDYSTPAAAGEYVKKQISGNGEWESLIGLDPNKCRLRSGAYEFEFYDLDGNKICEV